VVREEEGRVSSMDAFCQHRIYTKIESTRNRNWKLETRKPATCKPVPVTRNPVAA
jgi:hypothetical protein